MPGSGQAWPVHDVKISLCQFDEADEAIDCAKAGAEVKRAGSLFLDDNVEILAAFHAGLGGERFDFGKIAEILQAFLAGFYPHRVKYIAWRNQHFASDYLVLSPRVSGDGNALDVGALALINFKGEIN